MQTLIKPCSSYLNPSDHLKNLLTHPWYKILTEIYASIFDLTHEFYKQENIQPTLFPITTGSISSPMGIGSDSLPVKVKINGKEVYLADSMQFCLEIGARLNPKGAYYIMPTFRGEKMDKRHLNEFVHSEAEIKGTLQDVMSLAERYIKFLISGIKENIGDSVQKVTGTLEHLDKALENSFSRLRYEEAIAQLKNVEGGYVIETNGVYNITSVGEKYILSKYGDFTWLTNLPWKLVPFYQSQEKGNEEFSNSADLLAGIGEILGSGQRVLTTDDLKISLNAHQVDENAYRWYSQMREIQTVQTSGFGMGIERFILWLLKHDDIRDCTLLLRDHNEFSAP